MLYYCVSPSLAVLAILLNSIMISSLVRQYCRNKKGGKRGHSTPLIFLANLAISDLLVGLTVTVIKVITFLYRYKLIRWTLPLGWAYHIMKYAFLRLSLLTSVFNLASLTIDRFLAIRYPMLYRIRITNKHAFVVAGMTWILSVAFTATHYSISNFSGITLWKYDLIIFPAIVFPGALIFATCYTLILLEIRKQGRNMRNVMVGSHQDVGISETKAVRGEECCSHLRTDDINTKTSNRSANDQPVTSSSRKVLPLHIQKREIKIYKFAGTVVGVFLLCWLPIAICGLVLMVETVNPFFANFVFTLAFANSTIDPIVYFVFKDNIVGKMRRLFRLMCCFTYVREEQRVRRESNLFSLSSGESNGVVCKTRDNSSVLSTETVL